MSPIKGQLIEMINFLPETEQVLLLEIARCFLSDDVATPDDLDKIEMAREEFSAGKAIWHDSINWN